MTSHRSACSKMQGSTKEKKRGIASSCKEKSNVSANDRPILPLSKKSVYMDVKQGKQAKTLEEQLKKLGATVEKFLSREVNYVISSFGPIRQEERTSTGEDNPQSPSFVPSPFSCGPSPTATSDLKKNLVSRGKALAQIACAKNQTASTVISSAEKLGIKVVSVEVANKWLDKELKKLEKECSKNKKENSQEKLKKAAKKKRKVLKGAYIKFEACNRMYRPIKSELDHWPKLNLLAPPGLNPFTEVKIKMPSINVRRQLLRNKKTSCGVMLSTKARIRKCSSRSVSKDSGMFKNTHALPDLLGVPITTTGDVKRNMENHWKKRPDKLQGYCECCEEKYKDLNQHLNNEDHRSFGRNKSNYESLDSLISELCPPVDFLQNLILQHCSQKQCEGQPKCKDKQLRDALPSLNFNVESPVSSIKTANVFQEDIVALDMCTPQPGQDISSDARLISDASSCDGEGERKPDKRPHAVVIRRPTASGIFTSPRRRQPTPSKKPWMQERCMVFRDSPLASLQPSNPFTQINFTISERTLANPYTEHVKKISNLKETGFGGNGCAKGDTYVSSAKDDEFSTSSVCGPQQSLKSTEVKEGDETVSECLSTNALCTLKTDLMGGSSTLHIHETTALPNVADSLECSTSHELVTEKHEIEIESQTINKLREIQNIGEQEKTSVPCIADRVKTRTRKNVSGDKCEEKVHRLSFTDLPNNMSEASCDMLDERKNSNAPVLFDSISSGKSKREYMPHLSQENKCTKLFNDIVKGDIEQKDCVPLIEVNKCIEKEPCDTDRETKPTTPGKEVKSNQQSQEWLVCREKVQESHACEVNQDKSQLRDKTEHKCTNSPDSATLQPKSKRRKFNKDAKRMLFVESSSQRISIIKSPEKDVGGNRNSENCSRDGRLKNRNTSKAKLIPTADSQDAMSENSENRIECAKSNAHIPTGSVANSIRERVRQCRLFVDDGMYKEGAVVLLTDLQKKQLSTPSKKANCQESKKKQISAMPVDDCYSDSNVDDCLENDMQEAKHVSRKVDEPKSYEKKIRTSVDWNKTCFSSTDGECSSDSVKSVSPSKLIVPNIAERVKKRRSCTQFNHEGQYANDGEGMEEEPPKHFSSKSVNKQRKLLKAKKRLWYRLSQENKWESDDPSSSNVLASTEEMTDKTKESTSHLSSSQNKKSGKSKYAIVIRRGKPSYNALSKTDANWCKYLSDKDWSQCETEENYRSSVGDVGRDNFPSVPTQGHQPQTTSSSKEKESKKLCKDISQSPLSTCDSNDQHKHDRNESNELGERLLYLKKTVETLQLHNIKLPRVYRRLKGDQPKSPRLRLKIQRNPVDESYSSTLEEIYDDKPVGLDTFNDGHTYQSTHANKKEKNVLPVLKDTNKGSGCDKPTPVTPLKQTGREIYKNSPGFAEMSSPVRSQQSQINENKSNYQRKVEIGKDPDLRSLSRERRTGRKSASGRLKMRRSGSDNRKRKQKFSEEDTPRNCDGHNLEGGLSINTEKEGVGEVDEIMLSANKPLLENSLENDHADKAGCPSVFVTTNSVDQITHHSKTDNLHKDDNTEKSRPREESKSHKSLKQLPKKKTKRERSTSRDDSLRASKKIKISKGIAANSSFACLRNDTMYSNSVPYNSGSKSDFQDLPSHHSESDTTEVDFPKLHNEQNTSQTKLTEDKPHASPVKKTHTKRDNLVNESDDEWYVEQTVEEKSQSGRLEDNTPQASLHSNLGDYMTLIPTLSSPGKTNSSWDDACDSYLNTSAKLDHTPAKDLNTSTTQFSPSRLSVRPSQPGSSGFRSPRKTARGYFPPDVHSQFTSPTKRRLTGTTDLEMSPVIEKVDSVVSFNYMSPQRLQFSPKKCEKSVGHRRNLNSPSNNI